MLKWIKDHSKYAAYFILGAALIGVYKAFDSISELWKGVVYVFSAFKPFIYAFIIAYLLNIPIRKVKGLIDKKAKNSFLLAHSNAISITFVYIVFIGAAILVIGSIIPALTKDLFDMYENIPMYAETITEFLNNYEPLKKLGINADTITEQLNSFVGAFLSVDMVGYTKTLASGIISVTSSLMDVFIALIASIYMLVDKERILRGISVLVNKFSKDGKVDSFMGHWSRVNEIFTQYIYSRLTCCVIMGIACTIVLLIMGEKYALLLGIFIGFMDLIPYFGSIISWFVGFFVMAISGSWGHAIWCSIVILIMQQLDGNVLAPRVTSERLEIRPLAIIIAVSVGGSLFGFIGMLISVPVVAILRVILNEIIEVRTISEEASKNNEQ